MRTIKLDITNAAETEMGYTLIMTIDSFGLDRDFQAQVFHAGEGIAFTDLYATQIECVAAAHALAAEDIASRAAQVEPAAVVVVQTVNPRAALRTLDAPTEAAITNATGGKSEANIFFRREHGGYILLHNATVYTTAGRRKARKTAADVAALAKLVSDLIDGWHVAAMLAGWTWREIDNDCVWFAPVVASQSDPDDDEIDMDIVEVDYGYTADQFPGADHVHVAMQTNRALAINGADLAWANCPYCRAEGVQMERDATMPTESAWHVVESCIHAIDWNVGKTMANPYAMVRFTNYGYQPACHRCGASSMLIPHYGDSNTLICPECEVTSSGIPETLAVAAECKNCKGPEYHCSDCSSRLCFWHVMYFNMQPFCWHCRNKKIDAPAKAIELTGDCQPF